MSDSIHWPGVMPSHPLKRMAKVWLGHVLSFSMPARAQRVRSGKLERAPDFIDRQIILAWANRCLSSGNTDALAPLHQWIWRDDTATRHHEATTERFWEYWNGGHKDLLSAVADVVYAHEADLNTVCEIGCGQALAFAEITHALPGVQKLIGLDLSAAQTEQNRRMYAKNCWMFENANVLEWVPEYATPGTIFLTIGGVFEYLTQTQLAGLMRGITSRKAPAVLACIEPIAQDYDLEVESASRPFPPEHSYAHNYPAMMRDAGFTVDFVAERPFAHRWLLTVGHC